MRIDKTNSKDERFGGDTLYFTDGSYILTDHYPTCCECTYADFSVLETMPDVLDMDFTSVEISAPEDGQAGGFIMRLNDHPVFIPCYSVQNGYYSTSLDVYYRDASDRDISTIFISCEKHFDW